MHPVLLIDEIIRTVFGHIDVDNDHPSIQPTFVRLARVCRAWSDPALDCLWESLASFDPLLALRPGATCVNGTWVRIDHLSPTPCTRKLLTIL